MKFKVGDEVLVISGMLCSENCITRDKTGVITSVEENIYTVCFSYRGENKYVKTYHYELALILKSPKVSKFPRYEDEVYGNKVRIREDAFDSSDLIKFNGVIGHLSRTVGNLLQITLNDPDMKIGESFKTVNVVIDGRLVVSAMPKTEKPAKKMNTETRISPAIEMYDSLVKAVDEAGGSINLERFREMSFDEFIEHLAPNNIRFVYTGKRDRK